jgi:hypothetical protein
MPIQLVFSELVKTIELDPYPIAEPAAETLKFRIEILRRSDTGKFFARIYRRETFRLQPTFPQIAGKLPQYQGDHEFHILDDALAPRRFEEQTVEEVLKKVEEAIRDLVS